MARIRIRNIDFSSIPNFRSTPPFQAAQIYRQFLINRFITGADWIPSKKTSGATMRETDTLMNSITIKSIENTASVGYHLGIQHTSGLSVNRLAQIHQSEATPIRQVVVIPDAATTARMKRVTEQLVGRIIERDRK